MRKRERFANALRDLIETEAAVIHWCAGRSADDLRWWNGLPEYERQAWRNRHEAERHRMRWQGDPVMREAGHVYSIETDHFADTKRLAQAWSEEIRKAWKLRQPCPIIPTPRFQHVLDWAFQMATLTPDHFPPVTESASELAVNF